MSARYAVGIDLGTTQSVIAYADLDASLGGPPRLELLSVPQLLAASTIGEQTSLPSFLYLATEGEAASGSYDLPFAIFCGLIVFAFLCLTQIRPVGTQSPAN